MIIELLKAFFLGIVEGITEWLPISSTGHMILVDEFVKLDVTPEFLEVFLVVIQLGAIMAVIILYWNKLNPFSAKKTAPQKRETWSIWLKVLVATIPAGIAGMLLDDWVHDHFYGYVTVSIALIAYGVIFVFIERRNRRLIAAYEAPLGKHSKLLRTSKNEDLAIDPHKGEDGKGETSDDSLDRSSGVVRIRDFSELDYKTALLIGCFQCLAIIPGTSRSGSTIIGSMLLGTSRTIAAEFAFFLAIPIMFGWSLVKLIKYGFAFSGMEVAILLVGVVVAFVVSILAIKFLIGYIKKNDFTAFGWYRIVLGIVVLGYFGIRALVG